MTPTVFGKTHSYFWKPVWWPWSSAPCLQQQDCMHADHSACMDRKSSFGDLGETPHRQQMQKWRSCGFTWRSNGGRYRDSVGSSSSRCDSTCFLISDWLWSRLGARCSRSLVCLTGLLPVWCEYSAFSSCIFQRRWRPTSSVRAAEKSFKNVLGTLI